MIAMVESGRLGNQIFQYAALRSVARPHERLTLLGFDQLRETFDGLDARFIHIESNPLKHLVSLDYDRVARAVRYLPGVGIVTEDDDATPQRSPGSTVALARPAWFQSGIALESPAMARMTVKPEFVENARDFLSSAGLTAHSTAFVHVRAGDYRTWPSVGHPAILSPQWYRDRIAELRALRPDLTMVAIGDDADYTRLVLDGLPDALVYEAEYASEFALMTICSAGVLSASSFAYWGAYFAQQSTPDAPMLGAQFWAGHARGEWYPPHIQADFITYR